MASNLLVYTDVPKVPDERICPICSEEAPPGKLGCFFKDVFIKHTILMTILPGVKFKASSCSWWCKLNKFYLKSQHSGP